MQYKKNNRVANKEVVRHLFFLSMENSISFIGKILEDASCVHRNGHAFLFRCWVRNLDLIKRIESKGSKIPLSG